jgi:hypothetical protein
LTIRRLPDLFHCGIELELDLLKPDAKLGEPARRPIVFVVNDDVAVRGRSERSHALGGVEELKLLLRGLSSFGENLRRAPPF